MVPAMPSVTHPPKGVRPSDWIVEPGTPEHDAYLCEQKLTAIRAQFQRAGISVSEWARVNGFDRMTVVDVLRGQRQGLRGEAHRVAVALGLKEGDVIDVRQFKPGHVIHQEAA